MDFTKTAIISVIGATGRIGNALVALRCVSIEDKALSMAFNICFLSLLAMLPSPIIYGEIIDQACDLWQMECGETTNCMLYDLGKLRKFLMYTTACIMIFGVLFDVAVWYYCKDVVLFSKNEEKNDENGGIIKAQGEFEFTTTEGVNTSQYPSLDNNDNDNNDSE